MKAAQSRAARSAKAAANLAQREQSVAKKRAAAEQRITELTQQRQQAERRRALATRNKVEAEQAMAASLEQRKRLERDMVESRQNRDADSTVALQMRNSRYVRTIAQFVRPLRSAPVLLLIGAFALGIGVSVFVGSTHWAQTGQTAQQRALLRGEEAAAGQNATAPVLKMDADLSGFSARVTEISPSN